MSNEINFPAPPENIVAKLNELNGWRNERQNLYVIATQLEKLYDDVDAGLFGEAAKTGEFYNFIKGIKDSIPKPDVATIQAEVDALIAAEEENGD
jgi:hypothetical protein